jgi:hypothetical protein
MLSAMPRSWIYNLPKQQLEELAAHLCLPTDGALDDIRKRVNDRWSVIEPFLPSTSSAKPIQTIDSNQAALDSGFVQASSLGKVKVKLASELIAVIPP